MILDTSLSSQNNKKIIIAVKVSTTKHASGKLEKKFCIVADIIILYIRNLCILLS